VKGLIEVATPTKYQRGYSFSGYQATNPKQPLPAQRLDDELESIQQALAGAVDGLKDIRRSDGKLQNGSVTLESLGVDLVAGVLKVVNEAIADAVVQAATLYATKSAAQAAHIPAVAQYFRTAGYAAAGDGGGALYKRISAPATPKAWQFQDALGAWWQLAEMTVTPQMFGAKGDGGTDDSDAIQAAVDGFRSVYFPFTPNGYRVTKTITISQSTTTLYGPAGINRAAYINLANHTFDVFVSTASSDVEIRNIGIHNWGIQDLDKWAFRFEHTSAVQLHNITTYACTSGILLGADGSSSGGALSRLQGLNIQKLRQGTGMGIYKGSNSEMVEILDSVIAGPGTGSEGINNALCGIQVRAGAALVLHNLEIVGCGKPLYFIPDTGKAIVHTTMNNVWCDSSSDIGCFLNGSLGSILDVSITNSWFSSCNIGMRLTGNVRDVSIGSGCRFYFNRADAILIDNYTTLQGFTLEGSKIAANVGSGISIGADVSDFIIRGNHIGASSHFGANGNGIFLGGGNDRYIIDGNNLRNNAGVNLGGHTAAPSKVVENNIGFTSRAEGNASGTTNASGEITFNHGLNGTPGKVRGTCYGGPSSSLFSAHVVNTTASQITMKVFSGTTPVTSAAVTVYWEASL
jgi:hypothetical protein